jgi:hypothetical protein
MAVALQAAGVSVSVNAVRGWGLRLREHATAANGRVGNLMTPGGPVKDHDRPEKKAVMAKEDRPKTKRRRATSTGMTTEGQRLTRKRRSQRPLGLGEMSQRDFPFIAILNGETMIVDRAGQKIIFTPWI